MAAILRLRTYARPIAGVTLLAFVSTYLGPVAQAFAKDDTVPAVEFAAPPAIQLSNLGRSTVPLAASDRSAAGAPIDLDAVKIDTSKIHTPGALAPSDRSDGDVVAAPAVSPPAAPPPEFVKDVSLPTGGTEVASSAISLPSGAGTIDGMGESFSVQLSTGVATFTVPFKLPPARGKAQPSLVLSYSSGGGYGVAGVGWSLAVPAIFRSTDRGTPRYDDDPSGWHPGQDRFVFNGAGDLVPICKVGAGLTCAAKITGEAMPVWSTGWQYFRSRIEGAFLRFFLSPNFRTWRVQSKSGVTMELGVPLDALSDESALQTNPDQPEQIFAWMLARQYDTYGNANPSSGSPAPVNVVRYLYANLAGETAYLSDIYDTPPAANPTTAPLNQYAHHTRLVYGARPDPVESYRSGWRIADTRRLRGVDVGSKQFTGLVTAQREMVRRYHLEYEPGVHVSLLTSVQMEGKCPEPVLEGSGESPLLPPTTECPRLPAMKLGYTHVSGTAALFDDDGLAYDPLNETVTKVQNSPSFSLDESRTELMDVTSDGLPDVLVTAPGLFGGKHGLFVNGLKSGATSASDRGFQKGTMGVTGVTAVDAGVLTFMNSNVSALDVQGDAKIDLIHMPRVKKYEIFTPQGSGLSWNWVGHEVVTADQQDVRIDFTNDATRTAVMDVNMDGLVDVVHTSATEVRTFFALGRYPGGDGQFGHAEWTTGTTADISNDPVTFCLPWSATGIRFGDAGVQAADMNGDGLPDIVRSRKGEVRYWPGRGNGMWGTGSRDDCEAGTFGQDRYVDMDNGPMFTDVSQPGQVRLGDVNGDGLADVIEVRLNAVDVYLNVNGTSWTDRYTLLGTPPTPNSNSGGRVRIADLDGSGTPDIVWGDGYDYKLIDLTGGIRPHVLTKLENGLGASTEIEYATSTELMLEAEAAGKPWGSKAPMVVPVVRRSTTRDNLELVGRPAGAYVKEYEYRDPVYDGRQREFRGFKEVTVASLGDANGPTSFARSEFLLGECKDDDPTAVDPCTDAERWRDNGREALKGLPVLSESFDEQGIYLSTGHQEYTLQELYVGLDGRRVRHAFGSRADAYTYDTAPFTSSESNVTFTDVQNDIPGLSTVLEQRTFKRRASAGRVRTRTDSAVDPFGNATVSTAMGCVAGCSPVDEVITSTTENSLPPSDPTGWMWRPTRSYVEGNLHPGVLRNESLTEYGARGDPTVSKYVLSGSVPLRRFHEDAGAALAPDPATASGGVSAPVTVIAATTIYDSFGNATSTDGANGRCSSVTFDADYKQLPTVGTVNVGPLVGSCGSTALSSGAAYDRGLGVVATAVDARGQPTSYAYDGFGRVTSVTPPNPDAPGTLSPLPAKVYEYDLPTDASARPFSRVHTLVQDGDAPSSSERHESWSYIDGLGRTLVTLSEADPAAGDEGAFVASGVMFYGAKGTPLRAHQPFFYSGAPDAYPLSTVPTTRYAGQRSDAFSRPIQVFGLDGQVTLQTRYHALSRDAFDAADITPGPHWSTPMSVQNDGHGRVIDETDRIHVTGGIQSRHTLTKYLPTGEPERITRALEGGVPRWMQYDSQGRLVLNVEPNTSPDFTAAQDDYPPDIRAWRYAYDDAGDLVGTSDARGCGINYHYEAGGRLVAEDWSPCRATHMTYSPPNLSSGDGSEVFYRYDSMDSEGSGVVDDAGHAFAIDGSLLLGRLVAVSDRASKTLFRYDARGRRTGGAVRVAKPGTPSDALSARYAPRWYARTVSFDAGDRPTSATTGATLPENTGETSVSAVTTEYTRRGTTKRIGGTYGDLVSEILRDAEGKTRSMLYADGAQTRRAFAYDDRSRLRSVQTYRASSSLWSTPGYSPADPLSQTQQLLLEDQDYTYDVVGNITEIRDWRIPDEWPAGAKPVTRKFEYDDLYRLTRAKLEYAAGDDQWKSPFEHENQSLSDGPKPTPHVAFDRRILDQRWSYDYLGNISASSDDASGFYDRSLGEQTHGGPLSGPHQLRSASNRTGSTPAASRQGDLENAYDDAGNMTGMTVRRDGPCLPSEASCWQRFAYQWDEVGQLASAERWDLSEESNERADNDDLAEPVPARNPDVELHYAYDAGGDRVLKTAVDPLGSERHDVYIFESVELRSAVFGAPIEGAPADYELSAATETVYLFGGGARIARVAGGLPAPESPLASAPRVLLFVGDHLGSTATTIDKTTGELVEATTYQAYGGGESDYRPERWAAYREKYQFTGKEADVEVGLQYFGKRYYAPGLGRWISPDPKAIHELGSDLNPYAYVSGRAIIAVDPNGEIFFLIPILVAAAIGAAIGGGVSGGVAIANGATFGSGAFWGAVGIGAISGAASGATGGALGGVGLGAAIGAGAAAGAVGQTTGYLAASYINGTSVTLGGVLGSALLGGVIGAAAGAAGYGIAQLFKGGAAAARAPTPEEPLPAPKPEVELVMNETPSPGGGSGPGPVGASAGTRETASSASGAGRSSAPPTPGPRVNPSSEATVGRATTTGARETTVIGARPRYIELADELRANRLNIPEHLWEKMSPQQRWAINQEFLDRAIARGDQFALATPPGSAYPGSFYDQELRYLASKGYTVSSDGFQMVPPK